MPARNVLKQYIEDGVYHVYNRGVEKRDIFLDDHDYKYFLWLLKELLSERQCPAGTDPAKGPSLQRGDKPDFSHEIELLAYCLMPNHFHLLIRQKKIDSMSRFMRSLGTNYSMYFNRKYERVGALFQGRYKAVLAEDDNYLLHLSRYIHLNPLSQGTDPVQGPSLQRKLEEGWSSYGEYLGSRSTRWVKPEFVLDLLSQGIGTYGDRFSSYKQFVEEYQADSADILGKLTLEN